MHIYYTTIGDVLAVLIISLVILDFLWWGIRAFKAIVKDHSGYVDDLEMQLNDYTDLITELSNELASARESLSHVSYTAQANRLAERLSRQDPPWPNYGEGEFSIRAYERKWSISEDVQLEGNGPLSSMDVQVTPMTDHEKEIAKTFRLRDTKTMEAEHAAFLEEMEAAGYPAGTE